jgi:O-antigen ligase
MNNYLVKSISFLLVFFPIALVSGSFFPDFFASLSGLLFLIYITKNKEWSYLNNFFFKAFLFFYIYLILRELFSGHYASSFFYIRFIIFALAINFIIDKDKFFLKNFLLVSVLVIIIIFFDSLSIIFFKQNLLFQEPFNRYRLSSFFYDELKLGSFILRLSPVIFSIFIYEKLKINKYLITKDYIYLLSFYILACIIIINSGERASMVLFFIFSIVFFVSSNFINIKYAFVVISLTLLTMILIFINNSYLLERYADQFSLYSNSGFLENHMSLFKASFYIFLDNPIFGSGLKSFRLLCAEYSNLGCTTHPHNTYLESLSEIGIVGFSFVFSFFLYISYVLTQNIFNKKYNAQCIALLAVTFVNFFPLTTSGSFYGNWLSLLYYLPIGFLINFSKNK